MKKIKVEFEGIIENSILKIPIMDLFINDIIKKEKQKMYNDLISYSFKKKRGIRGRVISESNLKKLKKNICEVLK